VRLAAPGAARRAELAPSTSTRILLLGFDGLDWDVAGPLMAAGRMPHLATLVARGTRARLDTLQPILSPVIWTTVATGREPKDHGILDFLGTDAQGRPVPVTSNLRRTKAAWNVLSDAGESVGVVAWWATWPAEPVHGFIVSDRVAYQLFGVESAALPSTGKVFPPSLWAEVEPLLVRPADVTPDEVASFLGGGVEAPLEARLEAPLEAPLEAQDRELLSQFTSVLASTKTYAALALRLHERERPRLGAYYFEGTDTAAHLFMRYAPPALPEVDPVRQRRFGPVVARVYEQHDLILGRFLDSAGDDTVVMLVSDHGFRSGESRPTSDSRVEAPTAARWHSRYGVFVAAGPGVRPGHEIEEASVHDVFPTALALMGMPVAEDLDGRVLTAALTDDFLAAHPVRTVATFEDPGPKDPAERLAAASPEDRAILESLVAIGYVSPSTLDATPAPDGSGATPASPHTANAHNNLGTILLEQGDTEGALAEFRLAVAVAPAFVPARVNLAHALVRMGRPAEAVAELETVLADDAAQDSALSLLAGIHVAEGRVDDARRAAQRAVDHSPRSGAAWGALARAREADGDLPGAREAWGRAADLDPDDPVPPNAIGSAWQGEGDWARAAEWYERALEADPTYAPAYNNLALQYQRLGRFDEALAVYQRGRERLPGSSVLLNNLATWHHQAALAASQAVAVARAAGDADAAREQARRQAAAALEAERLYAEARAANPLDASPVNNLGALMGLLGREEEQLRLYREAARMQPDYLDALHNIGDWHLRRGDWAAAHESFGEVLKRSPDYRESLRLDALALIKLDRGDEAVAGLEAALGRRPDDAGLLLALGAVHDELGQAAEACRRYREADRLSPGLPGLAERLGALCGP
jgi:tetratricopeptide (TPR) repeat protein